MILILMDNIICNYENENISTANSNELIGDDEYFIFQLLFDYGW